VSNSVCEGIYGAYGVMVSTEVCGTSSTGSNPVRHPRRRAKRGGLVPKRVAFATRVRDSKTLSMRRGAKRAPRERCTEAVSFESR
jgi:hypothetical protein